MRRNLQVTILILTQFLILTVTCMSFPYWPLIIKEYGGNPNYFHFWTSLIYAVPLLASMFSSPFWGTIADRVGYKKMILRASFGLFITQSMFAFSSNPLYLAICCLLQGVFCGFVATAQALGIQLVTVDRQPSIIANLESASTLGSLLGPVLGGWIFTYFNYRYIFIISSVVCFVCAIALFIFIKEPVKEKKINFKNQLPDVPKLEAQCILGFIAIFLSQTARFMIVPVFALFVLQNLLGTIADIGILYAASGVMLFLFTPLFGKWQSKLDLNRHSPFLFVIICSVACTILQWWMAHTHNFYIAFLIRLLWGISLAGLLPILLSIIIQTSDNRIKGKVIGYASAANKFGNFVGVLLGSFCLQFRISLVLEVIALIFFVNVLVILFARYQPSYYRNLYSKN